MLKRTRVRGVSIPDELEFEVVAAKPCQIPELGKNRHGWLIIKQLELDVMYRVQREDEWVAR